MATQKTQKGIKNSEVSQKIQSIIASPKKPSRLDWLWHYGLAVLFVGIAFVIKNHWQPFIGSETPFLLFFTAITFSAFQGGQGPGILATLLSAFITVAFFLEPQSFLKDQSRTIQLCIFILEGILITTVAELAKKPAAERARLLFLEHRARMQAEKEVKNRKQVEAELLHSRNQLSVIFQAVAEGITVQDPYGKLLFANVAAAKLCGCSSAEEFLSMPIKEIIKRFELLSENGEPIDPKLLPGRIAINEKRSAEAVIRFKIKATSEERWALVKATPVLGPDNKIQFAINVFQDITEQRLLEQRKNEFVSMASHELKTPMTSIQGFTELLQKQMKNSQNPKAQQYLGHMREEVSKMSKIVADLLDVTRIRAGKLTLNRTHFRLSELLEETVEALQFVSAGHRIVLTDRLATQVFADRTRLGQVLSNFLTNAFKYSPSNKRITISAKKLDKEVIVSVEDSGIGIIPEELEQIFNLFYQSPDPTRPSRGLGIGLYISKEIIKSHGGKIWVESTKGKGSTFYFSLPLTK